MTNGEGMLNGAGVVHGGCLCYMIDKFVTLFCDASGFAGMKT